jgi:GTP-binding protein
MEWLGENGIPFSIVFTKLDKLTTGAAKKLIADYCTFLQESWEELPPIFKTSSEDRRGRDEILNYIEEMNTLPL